MRISQDILSLDSPVGGEEDTTLGDFVEDDKYLTPERATNLSIPEGKSLRYAWFSHASWKRSWWCDLGSRWRWDAYTRGGWKGVLSHTWTCPSDRSKDTWETPYSSKCRSVSDFFIKNSPNGEFLYTPIFLFQNIPQEVETSKYNKECFWMIFTFGEYIFYRTDSRLLSISLHFITE